MDIIQQIKERTTLSDIVRQHQADLKPAGERKFTCICPLPGHKDSKPSFHVDDSTGRFCCFGCDRHGDVIDFLEIVTCKSRKEIIAELATLADIKSDGKPSQAQQGIMKTREVFRSVCELYESCLKRDEPSKAYLTQRGLTEETLKTFKIGFAPNGAELTIRRLQRCSVGVQFGALVGILSKAPADKGGRFYDAMSGRIVFPITNLSGDVVGFGGRVIKDSVGWPKYRNTAASDYFKKAQLVFGLFQARQEIKRQQASLLVEGYVDVCSMHQAGFTNCVGSMGTAVTLQQLILLRQLAPTVILLMDGDPGGRQATIRALSLAFYAGLNVLVVFLPDGLDPDEFLREKGSESMKLLIKNAVDGFPLLLEHLEAESPDTLAAWIASFVQSQKNRLLAAVWAKKIGSYLGVQAQEILSAVELPDTKNNDNSCCCSQQSSGQLQGETNMSNGHQQSHLGENDMENISLAYETNWIVNALAKQNQCSPAEIVSKSITQFCKLAEFREEVQKSMDEAGKKQGLSHAAVIHMIEQRS